MDYNDMDAVEYILGTNNLEDVKISKEDIERILADIKKGKKEKSFLYELVQAIEEKKQMVGDSNGRRKV